MDYVYLPVFLLACGFQNVLGSSEFPEETLQRKLFTNYLNTARPFTNDSFNTVVNFHLELLRVVDLHIRDGSLEAEWYVSTNWEDERLAWNPSVHGGLDYINIPTSAIWTPNIILVNSVGNEYSHSYVELATVSYTGNVSFSRTAKLRSTCDLDLTHFPKDTQECHLTFASTSYDTRALTISTQYVEYANTSFENDSAPWSVMTVTLERETTLMDCCHEYDLITYAVKIKRNCSYCKHLYVMPVALLGLLVPFQFLLPINSRERSCFGCLLLIGCVLMSSMLHDVIPNTSFPGPKLGIYHSLTIVYIVISLLITISTLHYCDTWRGRTNVPKVVKKIFIGVIGSLLCADTPRIPLALNSDVPITEVTDADTKSAGLEHQLESVLCMMHSMIINMKRKRTEKICLHEWRIISLVLDRFFFVVFMVVYFITTLEFLG